MAGLLAISRLIDAINRGIGKAASWLILIAVLVSAGNALVRYVFSISSNAWLELQWYLFSGVFLLAAAWTLLVQEHVRIDIVTANFSKRTRDWIELLGHLCFLIPVCLVMLRYGIPFFLNSFNSGEMSQNAGGLIVWPVKVLLPIGFFLLLLQGISEAIKRIGVLTGNLDDPNVSTGHGADADVARLVETVSAHKPAATVKPN